MLIVKVAIVLLLSARFEPSSPPGINGISQESYGRWWGVQRPIVKPGVSARVKISGPWVDHSAIALFAGLPARIVEKSNTGYVIVTLSVPAGTPRGVKHGSLQISCPPIPFTDCRSTKLDFVAMVVSTGAVTGVRQSATIQPGTDVDLILTGTGLGNAVVRTWDPYERIRSEYRYQVKSSTTRSATTVQARIGLVRCYYPTYGDPTLSSVTVADVADSLAMYPFQYSAPPLKCLR
jgi:hypothetical protein